MPGELARLLQQEERAIQPHEEPAESVNLGTEEDRMLHDYVEIFAWSYKDMPGFDADIVVHRLPTKEDCPPVKHKVYCMHPEMSEKTKAEVMKQFENDS